MPDSRYSGYAGQFLASVCDESSSALRILGQLYPDGPKCASCGAPVTGKRALATFWKGERTYCATCETKFAPRAGTILADSKLTYAQFEILLLCLSLKVDRTIAAHLADVRVDTVDAWAAKIRFWESHV